MIQGGRHTIIPADIDTDVPLTFGAFCSIASRLRIVSGQHAVVDHPEVVSTYAMNECGWGNEFPAGRSGGEVVVGSDVWIGTEVRIMAGVTIGHGSIIAACSVVTKDVPPYSIVAGNPARVKRERFLPSQIAMLLRLAWWDWPDEEIRGAMGDLRDVRYLLYGDGGMKA